MYISKSLLESNCFSIVSTEIAIIKYFTYINIYSHYRCQPQRTNQAIQQYVNHRHTEPTTFNRVQIKISLLCVRISQLIMKKFQMKVSVQFLSCSYKWGFVCL